jgi:endonuclease YncB( thermonuclease family)
MDTATATTATAAAAGELDALIDDLLGTAAALSAAVGPPARAPPCAHDAELAAAARMADFSFAGARFAAKVVDVYDGDTLRVVFRHGGGLVQYRARMAGYDSPEMKPPKAKPGREKEVQAAHRARAALCEKLGDMLVFITCGPFDKYGRLLVTVRTRTGPALAEDGEDVNAWMVASGHGVPYDGGTKAGFDASGE